MQDTILTINVVEPALVRAVRLLEQQKGLKLKGLVLVDKAYADHNKRPRDETDLFDEIICDFNDYDQIQTALKPYMDRLLVATCRYEEAIQPFRKIIPFLPYINTPSPESLLWSTEKPLMRDRLHNYNPELVPRYQYMEAGDLSQLEQLIRDFKYPVVIKPSGLSKSLLVSRCNNLEELRSKLQNAFRVIKEVYARDRYPGKPAILIEEMMQGQMYSVDTYVLNDGQTFCLPPVRVITAEQAGLPGFYGYERRLPAEELNEAEVEAAYETSRQAIKALNLRSTTTHTEMYRTESGWKVIEIAARIGGYRDILYREVYGIEHFYNDLLIRMGEKPIMPSEKQGYAAVLNLYAETEGTINSISGVEQAQDLSSVIHAKSQAKPGDKAIFSTNGGDLIVDLILSNRSQNSLENDITEARRLIDIKVA